MKKINVKKVVPFVGGVVAGTAGVKVLASKDAKKLYTNITAAGLRAKECVMTTATNIKENADDILADAKAINDDRASEEECCCCEEKAEEKADEE